MGKFKEYLNEGNLLDAVYLLFLSIVDKENGSIEVIKSGISKLSENEKTMIYNDLKGKGNLSNSQTLLLNELGKSLSIVEMSEVENIIRKSSKSLTTTDKVQPGLSRDNKEIIVSIFLKNAIYSSVFSELNGSTKLEKFADEYNMYLNFPTKSDKSDKDFMVFSFIKKP